MNHPHLHPLSFTSRLLYGRLCTETSISVIFIFLLFKNVNFFTYVNAYMLNHSIIQYGFTNHEDPPVIVNADWLTTFNNRHVHNSIIHFYSLLM